MPEIPRCQWRELQQGYRQWWCLHHRCGQQRLTWYRFGAVWAVDFSTPPTPIEGQRNKIFAVRDVASGLQLVWQPTKDETAETATAIIESLMTEHGAPLVIKSDNGSAFQSESWKELLIGKQVTPLYSPPRTPRYNGSCEASNGSMKVRTMMLAWQAGDPTDWTSGLMARAQRQANELHRGEKPSNETASERWRKRERITAEDRQQFQKMLDAQRIKVHNQRDEAIAEQRPTAREQARQERKAIAQTLVELGILTVTWRSKPLPINAAKAARIT